MCPSNIAMFYFVDTQYSATNPTTQSLMCATGYREAHKGNK
jgi:hypothetical protein